MRTKTWTKTPSTTERIGTAGPAGAGITDLEQTAPAVQTCPTFLLHLSWVSGTAPAARHAEANDACWVINVRIKMCFGVALIDGPPERGSETPRRLTSRTMEASFTEEREKKQAQRFD